MCLFMGGGGMGEAMEPQFPPTDAAKAHKSRLQMIALVHLILAIAAMFALEGQGIY